jgi:hypothetical protein
LTPQQRDRMHQLLADRLSGPSWSRPPRPPGQGAGPGPGTGPGGSGRPGRPPQQ